MSLGIQIEVSEEVTPFLFRVHAALVDRTGLHEQMAADLDDFTREYLKEIAPGRHGTAGRLGAKPEGHLARSRDALQHGADGEGAWLSFPDWTGLSRAFRPYHLTAPTAKGKLWIAIPAAKSAYGKRAEKMEGLKFVPLGKDGQLAALVARAKSDGKWMVVFWLKKSVHIPQDRTLLPGDEGYQIEAEESAMKFVEGLEGDAV